MKITMEQLMKLIGKLETKAEDMYRDEDGYSFIVTTTKCLYKIDVIMDRGEFMNISIDVYHDDISILWIQWDLNWSDHIDVHSHCELGDKLFHALLARL